MQQHACSVESKGSFCRQQLVTPRVTHVLCLCPTVGRGACHWPHSQPRSDIYIRHKIHCPLYSLLFIAFLLIQYIPALFSSPRFWIIHFACTSEIFSSHLPTRFLCSLSYMLHCSHWLPLKRNLIHVVGQIYEQKWKQGCTFASFYKIYVAERFWEWHWSYGR